MKQVCTLAILISTVLITSCGYKASDDVKATSPQTTTPVIPVLTVDSTGKVTANAPGTNPNTVSNQSGANIVQAAAPSGALNPAHGQPGHRCEIAVGAPLDSKPVVTTTTTTTPSTQSAAAAPTITSTTPTPAASSGPNPAHGQPGHRCDIAVGAPLNSKPTTTTTTAPAANTTPLNITPVNSAGSKTAANPIPVTPVLPAGNTQSPVATAPGMNPAHGQPGHRCDIAVGAPLNSKPTATKQ
jgi:hypothetical protein